MMVEGATGQVIDSDDQELTVPDLHHGAGRRSSTPRVYRVRTRARAAGDQGESGGVRRTPDRDVQPRGAPVRPGGRATAPAARRPSVTARLLNRGGTQMADVPVASRHAGPAGYPNRAILARRRRVP